MSIIAHPAPYGLAAQPTTLHFVTYLAPALYETYAAIARYIGETISCATSLSVGQHLEEMNERAAHLAFLCGLHYIRLKQATTRRRSITVLNPEVELLAAPVLDGKRYRGRPIYFSDVVVRRESCYTSLDHVRGGLWAYNERLSHSGWNIVRASLSQRGETLEHFARPVKSGSHQQSLALLLQGKAEVTALDSQVLDVLLRHDSSLAPRLRVIDTFGPSPVPPIVISKALAPELRARIQTALLSMHRSPQAAVVLRRGAIARFVPVTDEDYDMIEHIDAMQAFYSLS